MKKRKRMGLLLACILFGFILSGDITGYAFAQANEIRVGVILPFTGAMAPFAELCKRGHDIALEMWNEKGGFKSLKNAKAKYVYVDAQSDVQTGRTETEKLIIVDKVIGITGAYASSVTYGATEIAERYGIPFVVDTAVADNILERGFKTTFRTCINSTMFSNLGWQIVKNVILPRWTGGELKIGVIVENTLMGTSMAQGYKKSIEKEPKTKLVLFDAYDPKSSDLSAIVLKIKSVRPDIIMCSQYISDAILLNNQMFELGVSLKARVGVGAGYTIPEFIQGAGKNVENVFAGTGWNYDVNPKGYPGIKEYVQRYQEKYKALPEQHSALSLAASLTLFDAIERAGSTDGEKILQALEKTDLQTAGGPVKFDKNHQNIVASQVAMQIQKGNFVTVWPDQAAAGKVIFPATGPK